MNTKQALTLAAHMLVLARQMVIFYQSIDPEDMLYHDTQIEERLSEAEANVRRFELEVRALEWKLRLEKGHEEASAITPISDRPTPQDSA